MRAFDCDAHSGFFSGSLHEPRVLTGFAVKAAEGGGELCIFVLLSYVFYF